MCSISAIRYALTATHRPPLVGNCHSVCLILFRACLPLLLDTCVAHFPLLLHLRNAPEISFTVRFSLIFCFQLKHKHIPLCCALRRENGDERILVPLPTPSTPKVFPPRTEYTTFDTAAFRNRRYTNTHTHTHTPRTTFAKLCLENVFLCFSR